MPADLFWFRTRLGHAELGFTDARTDLGRSPDDPAARQTRTEVADALSARPAVMDAEHGARVAVADPDAAPTADALIVDRPGVAAIVRVADCVPVVLADAERPLAAVVHAGRAGVVAGVTSNAVEQLFDRGAERLEAWLGPRACGGCYEVPESMADEVARIEPATRATTRWDTPALDIGAGVAAQLSRAGVTIHDLGGCTIEDDRFWSHRRQGAAAGRFGAAVALHEGSDHVAP